MEIMIRKLREEVSILKAQLGGGGKMSINELRGDHSPSDSPVAKKHSKASKSLQEENENLQEQLLELQTEFDHYKATKSKQIEELTDKVEKMETDLEKYENQEALRNQLKTFENRVDQLLIEKESVNDLYQQAEALNSQREAEVRELENQNDDLRQQLENQSFEIFFRVRQEIALEFEEKNIKELTKLMSSED